MSGLRVMKGIAFSLDGVLDSPAREAIVGDPRRGSGSVQVRV